MRRHVNGTDSHPAWHTLRTLADDPAVERAMIALIVFGSLTRDDWAAASDVDLAVVIPDDGDPMNTRRVIKRLWERRSPWRISPSIFTTATLEREAQRRPTFAAHLVDEGVVLAETPEFDWLEKVLIGSAFTDASTIEIELRERATDLELFYDLRRFNGEFVPMLAQLYSLSRSIVIGRLLQQGVSEYSWRRIFDLLADRCPHLAPELVTLRNLRPFYEHIHGQRLLTHRDQGVDPRAVQAAIHSLQIVIGVDAYV